MDKETLIELKQYAELMSDLSTKTFLYKKICKELEENNDDLLEGTDTLLISKIKILQYPIGTIKSEKEWIKIIGRAGLILPLNGSDVEVFSYYK
jgi:uncharacterized protein with PhoU and TrkA domain